ncbi:MAG TPA: hypothetical protein VK589_14320, partial [Chryseolinea sp.]|nr:hypothetical protein [Chryseolinea sp.]
MKTKAPVKSKVALAIPKAIKKKRMSNGKTNGIPHETHSDTAPDKASAKELLRVLTEVKNGNFTVRMPIDEVGMNGKIYDTLNEIISLNEKMMLEFTRAGNTIGKQGKLTKRIETPSAKGSWREGVDSLNVLISDLVHPTIEIAHVISSVANG